MIHYIPFGTTEYQDFEAEVRDEDNALVEEDLSGSTLALRIVDLDGTTVTGAGTVAWVDATDRHWRFTPSGTLPRGKYRIRLTVTLGGRTFFVPNGSEPDEWRVVNP